MFQAFDRVVVLRQYQVTHRLVLQQSLVNIRLDLLEHHQTIPQDRLLIHTAHPLFPQEDHHLLPQMSRHLLRHNHQRTYPQIFHLRRQQIRQLTDHLGDPLYFQR